MEKAAIVDLGTNTFHLMIVNINEQSYEILHRERVPVRIGKDGISKGLITPEAIDRAKDTLTHFRNKIEAFEVEKVRIMGTSAIRNAGNKQEFLSEIKDSVGLEIEVIDGKEESELILEGVRLALNIESTSLVMDIGGGSIEFIICDDEKILWNHSFEIGAQRLLDQFHKIDPISQTEITELEDYFKNALVLLSEAITIHKPTHLIGSSGTFDTLSEIYCAENDIEINEGQKELPLTLDAYRTIHEELITKNKQERLAIPGMVEMRVDMIVVSSCLVKWIIDKFSFEDIRVSTYALKEGVLHSMMKRS